MMMMMVVTMMAEMVTIIIVILAIHFRILQLSPTQYDHRCQI